VSPVGPDRATACATAFFCPRGGERVLEDLDLEGLAFQETLELPDPLFELADLGGADHLLVDPDRFPAAFAASSSNTGLSEKRRKASASPSDTSQVEMLARAPSAGGRSVSGRHSTRCCLRLATASRA
jgi:hypothetical protein